MTVDELKGLSNERIVFECEKDTLLIKSQTCRYADLIKADYIESIERQGKDGVVISVPNGTSMGDHSICIDLTTGIVVADGKTFSDSLPQHSTTKKAHCKRFTPTINGFSIGSVQTMPSEDGYACYCKVYFNGKKVGDFVDKGDGGEYSFYADKPYSTSKIEQIVRSFPPTVRDYGLGPMEVQYDMNQMVNDLMEMKEIAKELQKLEIERKDYVRIDDWKNNRHLTASVLSSTTDETVVLMTRTGAEKG